MTVNKEKTIEERNKQLVRKFMADFSIGNVDRILSYMSETATWWVAGTIEGVSGEKNMAAFREMLTGLSSQTKTGAIRLTPLAWATEGNRVAVETESYSEMNNGKVYNNLYHFVFEITENGKIQKVKEYLDTEHTRYVFLEP